MQCIKIILVLLSVAVTAVSQPTKSAILEALELTLLPAKNTITADARLLGIAGDQLSDAEEALNFTLKMVRLNQLPRFSDKALLTQRLLWYKEKSADYFSLRNTLYTHVNVFIFKLETFAKQVQQNGGITAEVQAKHRQELEWVARLKSENSKNDIASINVLTAQAEELAKK